MLVSSPNGSSLLNQNALPTPVRSSILLALVAAIYLLAFPYHPKLRSPNELSRLWQARALVDHGTLELGRTLADHGRVGDLSVFEGRYYPSKAPLLSFAAVPVVAVLEGVQRLRGALPESFSEASLLFWSRLFLTILPALAMLGPLRRFLAAYLEPDLAEALTATYALGTMALCFAQMFISHQLTGVLLFSSFYALWRWRRGDWGNEGPGLAGIFAGAALACEYTAAIGVVGLGVYGLATDSSPRAKAAALVRACLGASPFVVALMVYHALCFGHPLESGYRHLNDAGYQPWHLGGFLGIRLPDWRALYLSLFSPLRGLFALSPFLLLAPFGVAKIHTKLQDRALLMMSAVLLVLYLYFTSAFSYDSWGWTPGPRHLTPWLPFLALPAGLAIQSLRGFARGGAAGLCAISILITTTVVQVNYVPDDLSTALGALALPLLREGYWMPTVVSLLGAPLWAGGLLVLTLSVTSAVWVAGRAMGRPASAVTRLGLFCGLVVPSLFLLSATRHDANDRAAVRLLKASWLAR
jgi:hypothetical protein